MHIHSPSFEGDDLHGFIHEVVEYEKARPLEGLPTDRLEQVSERLADIARFVGTVEGAPAGEWTPRKILAHVASQVFGWAAVAVGQGEQTTIDVLSFLRLRDAAGANVTELPPDDLVHMVRRPRPHMVIGQHEALVRLPPVRGSRGARAQSDGLSFCDGTRADRPVPCVRPRGDARRTAGVGARRVRRGSGSRLIPSPARRSRTWRSRARTSQRTISAPSWTRSSPTSVRVRRTG